MTVSVVDWMITTAHMSRSVSQGRLAQGSAGKNPQTFS